MRGVDEQRCESSERRSPTTRSSPVGLSAKSSSSSLDSPSSSLVSSSSVSGAWADFILKLMTASFADMPKLSAFDLRRQLQIGQALMSGRLHSRWKESAHSLEKCATKDCHGCNRSYHICCVNGNRRYILKTYISYF